MAAKTFQGCPLAMPLLSEIEVRAAPILSLNLIPEDSSSLPAVSLVELEKLGSFRKKPRGRLSPFRRLSKAHAWSASVLVDELDARGLQRGTNCQIVWGRQRGLLGRQFGSPNCSQAN